jgi:hypothetical protein
MTIERILDDGYLGGRHFISNWLLSTKIENCVLLTKWEILKKRGKLKFFDGKLKIALSWYRVGYYCTYADQKVLVNMVHINTHGGAFT